MADKVFESKSIKHITSYKIVEQVITYLLSYSILNYVYQQFLTIYNKLNQIIITPYFSTILIILDGKFNSVLTNIDYAFVKSFNVVKYTNEQSLKKLNHYFPDESSQTLKQTSNEIEKSIEIFKQFLIRFYKFSLNQSNSISNHIVSTYNQQVKQNDGNIVTKNLNASLNTANITFETYIKPLQSKTTDLYNDGKSYLNDVTTQTKTKINDVTNQTKTKINDVTTQTKTKITDVTTQTKNKAQQVLNDGKKKAQEYISVEEVPVVKASA